MAVSSTSSASSMLGITGKGIGGLATGLDTDSLVEALTASTRSKIAKQGQQKQLLNWKMTAYRSMTSALTAFQSKFLQVGSASTASTNIRNASFFNTYKATSSSSKVSVATTANSSVGNFTIDKVQQLAEAEKISSTTKLSSTLGLDIYEGKNVGVDAFTGKTLKLEVEGFPIKTIKLDDLNSAIRSDGTIDMDAFKQSLQGVIDKTYGTKTAVKDTDGHPISSTHIVDVNTFIGEDGKERISLDSDTATIFAHSNSQFGLKGGETNRVSTSTKLGALDAFKNVQGNTMSFTINGVNFEVSKDDTITSLMKKINESSANVRMEYDKFSDKFSLTSKATGAGENIVVRDVHGNLMNEIFGAQSGSGVGSGFLTTGSAVSSLNANTIDSMTADEKKALASSLSNMTFDMTVNGETKKITLNTSGIDPNKLKNGTYTSKDIYDAINKGINATTAFYGSGVTFSAGADGTTKISSDSGEAFSVKLNGKLGEILGFGSGTFGNTVMDNGLSSKISAGENVSFEDFGISTTGVFEMTVNGVTKTLSIGAFTSEDQNNHMADALNAAINNAFGSDVANKVKFTGENEIDYHPAEDGEDGEPGEPTEYVKSVKLALSISDSSMSVSMGSVSGELAAGQTDIFSKLGFSVENTGEDGEGDGTFNPVSNATGTGIKLNDLAGVDISGGGTLTVNGKEFTYTDDMTLDQFITGINDALDGAATASLKNGKLSIDGANGSIKIEDTGNMLQSMFGIGTKDGSNTVFETKPQAYGEYRAGKNAEIIIDGKVVSNATNTISYNGVSITVNEVSAEGDPKINVGVQSDPDDVVKRIKEWMDDYNALVYTLNSAINEGKNSSYPPLTDEQKADMTDEQVKKWETEAQKGILRNDQTLRSILADMRSSFYQKVESAGIALHDIGIVTKSGLTDPNEAGQLEFDKNLKSGGVAISGEDRLRDMLNNNPDAVRLLFTATDGIGAKLNDVIQRATSDSSVNRGTLVRLAGTEKLTGDNTSQLKDKISNIDKYISQLKLRLQSEHSRYWKKFSSLETSVQKLNMQSSWLQSS